MLEVAVVGSASRGHPPTQVLMCRRSRHHPASRIFLHCSAGFHASLPNVPMHRPFRCALIPSGLASLCAISVLVVNSRRPTPPIAPPL
jgi:hypothetical protein